VRTPEETAAAVRESLRTPGRLAAPRRRIAREFFFEPGTATTRAVELVRGVLPPSAASRLTVPSVAGDPS
jgi:hypothetical protein